MKKTLIASALAFGLVSGTASALVIDDYTGASYSKQTGTNVTGDAAGNSSSGYVRTVDITTSGANTTVTLNAGASPNVYAHSQDSGVTGKSVVNYALGGVDLTEGGTKNAFSLLLNSVDLNGTIGVIVDGVSSSLNTTNIILTNGTIPSYADFLFSDFAGVDLTNANTVSVFVDGSGQAALDASIALFQTTCSGLNASGGSGANGTPGTCAQNPPPSVPEPGPLALMGLGLLGLMRFGRRQA